MSVNVTDITEQPYGARNASPSSEQAGVPALRQALIEGDDPELDTPTRSIEDLREAVAQIKEWDRRTKHAEAVRALPDVHYWIDLSRGWLLHGDRRRSLEALNNARRIAPQLTRYHPQVHETVQALAASDARSTNSLAHFAAWCGIRH